MTTPVEPPPDVVDNINTTIRKIYNTRQSKVPSAKRPRVQATWHLVTAAYTWYLVLRTSFLRLAASLNESYINTAAQRVRTLYPTGRIYTTTTRGYNRETLTRTGDESRSCCRRSWYLMGRTLMTQKLIVLKRKSLASSSLLATTIDRIS